ncbi:putative hemoglobin and hemoglobin-haptoglobin-binding protein 3 [Portunus trituberculatus]|uniref:Putative hemoglobin and hemoglobin-haptoglobin-binding protein 3 n=1 Tax=Portunus trituberculatus TaxID=210409 RepID=A0A5B7FWA1_PORTR|nr:putative hemoglobin and hemoglobin-haptoglobin-binding protein 3 [Portunus trituberculatus]
MLIKDTLRVTSTYDVCMVSRIEAACVKGLEKKSLPIPPLPPCSPASPGILTSLPEALKPSLPASIPGRLLIKTPFRTRVGSASLPPASLTQPASQPGNQAVNQPTNQPHSQPHSQPPSQPPSLPANHPANQATSSSAPYLHAS